MVQAKTFNECVVEAKKIMALLKLTNKHRMKVAELAIKSCTILHGGRAPVTRLTLLKFARKININEHTLYEWVRVKKKVFDKLNHSNKILFETISSDAMKEMLKSINEKSESKINQEIVSLSVQSPIVNKYKKYARVMNTVLFNVGSWHRTQEIPDTILMEYLQTSIIIQKFCEKTLESRKAKVPIEYKKPIIDWNNFWEGEVFNEQHD